MPRIVYRIRDGAQLEPERDGYRITFGDGGSMHLSAAATVPVLYVDGWRSQGQIEQQLKRDLGIPDGLTDWVIQHVATAGLVVRAETEWRPLQPMPWPAHRCQSCGACCQGEWIGPLDPAFIEQTLPRLPALREKYPQLEGRPAFVKLDPEAPSLFLNSQSGQCVFLDDDMLCILHKEHGAMGKPSQCRIFPHVRFEDDGVTRLGVGLMCLRHYDQVIEAEAPAGDEHWVALNDTLEGDFFHYYKATGATLELEEQLVEQLGVAEDPLELALTALGDAGGVVMGDPAVDLERRALAVMRRLDDLLDRDRVLQQARHQKGLLPARLNALLTLGEARVGDQPRVPSAAAGHSAVRRRMIGDLLRRFFFLRQYLMFDSPRTSLAAVGLGVWTGLALAAEGAEGDVRFGECLATFMRTIQSAVVRAGLFDSGAEATGLLSSFRAFWLAAA